MSFVAIGVLFSVPDLVARRFLDGARRRLAPAPTGPPRHKPVVLLCDLAVLMLLLDAALAFLQVRALPSARAPLLCWLADHGSFGLD